MVRNIVLAVSSLAVLVVLFVGYTALVDQPAGRRGASPIDELAHRNQSTGEPIRVGEDLQVPAGGRVVYRQYDERTGRPTDVFSCQDWQPVPGSKNEIRVTQPELVMLLPSGMIALISADEGQVAVDRIQQSQMRPKQGWLAGNVQIVIDRQTGVRRTPQSERPEDLITISVDRLGFDLESGELRTPEGVTVESEDFEIAGVGLEMVWNQADNRVETLSIARGDEFVLFAEAGLFGAIGEEAELDAVNSGAPPATAAVAENRPLQRKAPRRKPTAYICTLTGDVVATHCRGREVLAGLEADEVRLLFDVGRGAGKFLRTSASSAPASRPAREQRERLVVRWNGPLKLGPAESAPNAEHNRRRFVALGSPVVLTRGDGTVRCAKVEYHDDTRQLWLYPVPGGQVEFGMGQNLSASAVSVYVDLAGRLVKLIGDVELRSRRGTGQDERVSSIRSAHWAELRLAERTSATQPAAEAVLDFDRLESATFVGDVQVELGEQALTGHRLDVAFHPGAGEQSLERLLDTATASGQVRLTSGSGAVACGQLEVAFGLTEDEDVYPRWMRAVGAVVMERGKAHVSGDQITAGLAPPPPGQQSGGPEFVLRKLDVLGEAELIDPDNRVAARGRHIAAVFEGDNRLTTATVSGTADAFGLVHARPYTVRGERIELDRDQQTVHVDGPSRLSFKTRRSLQGQRRRDPTPVVVTSRELLHIDGRADTVRFVGEVAARSDEEQLGGDTLTLLLEDVPEPESPADRTPWRELWREARGLLGQEQARDDPFDLRSDDPSDRVRKEPVRLIAENALVTSDSYQPGDEQPVVHTDISAPLLEVDIVNRQIFTTGLTQLLMIDRRGLGDAEGTGEALGLPSALLSRGASQTAMRCEGRMTYALGREGPQRRDTVVFEKAVRFVHCTGTQMANWEQMLPEVVANPELLERLKSRNARLDCERLECWFTVDETLERPRRGGALTRAPLRLASLLASDSVYLRDEQESRVREVNAAWVEFSREEGRIRVQGADRIDARIYFEDRATGQSDVHVGERLIINLRDGTIRTSEMKGEMRRP